MGIGEEFRGHDLSRVAPVVSSGCLSDVLVSFCANIVLITALMPYASPFILSSLDAQLMALVASSITLLVLLVFAPKILAPCRADLYILGFGLFTFCYINPFLPNVSIEMPLRACLPMLLGFPVYFAVRVLYRHMAPRLLAVVVAFYLVAIIVQLKFPGLYVSSFSHVLSDVRFSPEEGRGPNGLTPEPSMMADMAILFAVSLYFFHREYWLRHKLAALFVLVSSLLMLLITQSATGVTLALVMIVAAVFTLRFSIRVRVVILSVIIALTVLAGSFFSLSDSRGALILSLISRNPLLILQERTFADRILNVFVGLYQLPQAPAGNGDTRPNPELTDKALNGDAATLIWPYWGFRSFLVDSISFRENISGVGGMIQRMGVFGILIGLALIRSASGFQGKWVVRVFIVGLLLNASMFISTLWFIVGCCVELQRAKSGNGTASPLMTKLLAATLSARTQGTHN